MSELHELHQAWERADARLHAHLARHHRSHLSNEHEARVVVHGGEPADARIMRICFVPPPAYDSAMRAAPPILDFPSILDLVSPLVRYLECVGP